MCESSNLGVSREDYEKLQSTTIAWSGTLDAAHFIPGHSKCGRLHGHTYRVEISMRGRLPAEPPFYLVDYGAIKEAVMAWDHRLLAPSRLTALDLSTPDARYRIQWRRKEDDPSTIQVVFLTPDSVVVLKALDSSAECLAQELLENLQSLPGADRIDYIEVAVSETPKTEARVSWTRQAS